MAACPFAMAGPFSPFEPEPVSDFAALFRDQAEANVHVQFVYDVAAGRVVYVNPAYERVLGGHRDRANEELPGLLARLHPDDRAYLARYWQLWAQGQMADEVQVRLLQPNQPDQWFCLTPHFQRTDADRGLVAGTLRDISVSKHHQDNSDTFNTRKNAVLEILAHDLSGAFALMQQIAVFLREEVSMPEGSRATDMLHVLENTSVSSVKMIRDLINIEFLASANTDLKRDRVEVGTVLREQLEELQQSQKLLGQQFTYALPAKPVYALLDLNKFNQVLTNLIGNALKFTPAGGAVAVTVEAIPGKVRLQVRDTGIGIPAALQPQLFERFTRARRPGLRGEPTTGLGLALCKTIVEWHQGTISVASTEGQGSTFAIEIPQAEA